MAASDLVTVIIPAYNAEGSIDETIRSVRSQTHAQLEILIIDDGSRDATAKIVMEHAAQDGRLRLIQQENSGVAAARNRGIAEATAELVAPVDADDLWAPDKIEKQLNALRCGGENVGLVYTWFALIDAMSCITEVSHRPTDEGDVLLRLLRFNFVGNGSSALMRKAAVLEAGGYDPSLRARAAQGCEDYKLYIRMAERCRFAVVPEFLTGYRQTVANMSGNTMQMFRSWSIVAGETRERWPKLRREIDAGSDNFLVWLLGRAQMGRRFGEVAQLSSILLSRNPLVGLETTTTLTLPWVVRGLLRRIGFQARPLGVPNPPRFAIGIPAE